MQEALYLFTKINVKVLPVLKFFFVTALFFSFLPKGHASMHYGEEPDQKFVKLAGEFPFVGRFWSDNYTLGSGTLLKVGNQEFKGRLILTAVPVVNDPEFSIDTIHFTLNNQISKGRVLFLDQLETVHSDISYKMFLCKYCCLFLLDSPIEGTEGALIQDKTLNTYIGHYLITVGYGQVSHLQSPQTILDILPRASYSRVTQLSFNNPFLIRTTLSPRDKESGPSPLGLSSLGDNGGGLFNSQHQLVGVVIQESDTVLDQKAQKIMTKLYAETHPNMESFLTEEGKKPLIIAQEDIDSCLRPDVLLSDEPGQTVAIFLPLLKKLLCG